MLKFRDYIANEVGVPVEDLHVVKTDGKIVATAIKDGKASQYSVFVSIVPLATPEIDIIPYGDWMKLHKFSIDTDSANGVYRAYLCTSEGRPVYAKSPDIQTKDCVRVFAVGTSKKDAIRRLIAKINNRNEFDFFAKFYLDANSSVVHTELKAIIDLRTSDG